MKAEILIYDVIGSSFWMGGVSAKSFAEQLKALGDFDSLDVRINSPGGVVDEAVAIYSLIRDTGKPVTCYIDGLAASAASVVALAGDERVMAFNASYMIHDPYGGAMGTAETLRKEAEVLDHYKGVIRDTYVARSNLKDEQVAKMMADETWLNATDAMKHGFVTSITKAEPGKGDDADEDDPPKKALAWDARVLAAFNQRVYRRAPQSVIQQFSQARLDRARKRHLAHSVKVARLASLAGRRARQA